ncbi:MAG: hypothetical protein ACRDSL_03045 [Pseudonocardiaceae bacterium]
MARARRKHPQPALAAVPVPLGRDVPAELADVDAAVWHDQRGYLQYMTERGWRMPPQERMSVPASPARRRGAAVAGWAHQHGVTATYGGPNHPHPDWHRLRELGLRL